MATVAKEVLNSKENYTEKYGFSMPESYVYKADKGLSEEVVRKISQIKNEPQWMTDFRIRSLKLFLGKPMPKWGANLTGIDFNAITYYLKATDTKSKSWEDVPENIKKTFDRLGIPEAEKKFLAGAGAQYDSEVIYHQIREDLEKQGVIFKDMDSGLKEHEDLVKKYFGTVIPPEDNKFAALNSAVWSGGCLTEDSKVFTANPGVKSISKIEENDIVYALDKNGEIKKAKVLAKIHSGKKDVWSFFVGGRTLEATGNHMFLSAVKSSKRLDKHGKLWHLMWRPLEQLKEGDIIAIAKKIPDNGISKTLPELRKYIKNHHKETIKVPEKTSEDLMWFLGLWMGDGCTYFANPNMCQINIALPENDPVREKAIKIVKKIFNYKVTTKNENSFTIYSKALGVWLKDIGFTGKAKTKRIPEWVFGLPISERLSLLGGLLDTDGYTDNNGKVVRFELANFELIKDIKLLSISCGLYSNGKILERTREAAFFKKEQRKIYSGTAYSCRITGNLKLINARNAEKLRKIKISQKHTFDKYTTVTGENLSTLSNEWIGFAPIKEKKHIGIKDVYDIQVDKHSNFIVNGIIAHNSFVFVPKGVHVEMPLQAYFRINAKNMGQFERTLIIAEPGSSIHYIEGCFTKGASIRTAEGTKKIEDIKEDDIVLTHSGSYKKVYKTMKRKHNGTLCTIKFSNNPKHELKITGGHPILAVEKETINQKNWKPKWIEAGQLDNFDYIAMPITEFSKMAGQLNLTLSADDLMLQQKIILYANKICSYAFVPIKYIEKEIVTDLDVYNFSVEEDESYVANGIVVHNCTAPSYSSDSLHSAVVELIAMEGSKIQYTTIQNWSSNVYNLVTKRAFAYKNAEVFWVDGNIGSRVTMKFPAVWLLGEGARGEVLSVAFAGAGQHQDAGAKILHFAPNTSSVITNKSISKDGGKTTYRGLVKVAKGATNVKSNVVCDALILDDKSSSDTVPYMELEEKDIQISHEATVGKINEDQLFYLMSRGMSEREAMAMIVRGFIERFTKTLPMEYAIELNRLVELEMEGSVG